MITLSVLSSNIIIPKGGLWSQNFLKFKNILKKVYEKENHIKIKHKKDITFLAK